MIPCAAHAVGGPYNAAMTWTAITREVSPALADGERSFVPRVPIDLGRARDQHATYCAALESLGCEVIRLPAEQGLPDSVFVEDVALAFDELAVATRPGAVSRRDEGAGVVGALARYRPMARIDAPGTLDGGDVLRIGKRVLVGDSARSNAAGREQLRALLAPFGYTVEGVALRDCLHLKSAATEVADGAVLVNPDWVDVACFAGCTVIEVDPHEPHAANALRIGDALLFPDQFPGTQGRLAAHGIRGLALDLYELQKAEGAVTCCSIVFRTRP